MSTHSGVKDTDFDVEDSTKPQLEPIEVQLADDLVKLSEGYQDPSQVIDGGVDPEASIDLRRGARPRTLTVRVVYIIVLLIGWMHVKYLY